jgi:hypothetical protein
MTFAMCLEIDLAQESGWIKQAAALHKHKI